MKKFILVILMTLPVYIYAQDIIDPEPLGYNSTYSQLVQEEQSGFVFGWNWSSPGKNLDDALHINTYHDYPFHNPNTNENVKII